jgi:hypothetical protein
MFSIVPLMLVGTTKADAADAEPARATIDNIAKRILVNMVPFFILTPFLF